MADTPKNANGQATMANSSPVVLASDQSAVAVTSTSLAVESGGNLAAIKAKTDNIPAQGQALAAASLPVVLTAAQVTTLTPPAAITGYATETTLASIKDTAGIKKITDALPTGTNSIGKISDITTSITPGTAAANLGKAEDAAHNSGDVGVMMLGVRNEGHDDFSGTDKDYVPLAVDASGELFVNVRSAPSTAVTNAGTFATQSAIVAATSGGCSMFRSIDIDETEEDVKTSAGMVYGWYMQNKNAATLYVKFYNATAANTTVGTTTPVLTLPLPTGAAANVSFPQGLVFDTAICVACTTGVADNDTGAPSANDCIINVFYK